MTKRWRYAGGSKHTSIHKNLPYADSKAGIKVTSESKEEESKSVTQDRKRKRESGGGGHISLSEKIPKIDKTQDDNNLTIKRRNISPGVEKIRKLFEEGEIDTMRKAAPHEICESQVKKQINSFEEKSEKEAHVTIEKPKTKMELFMTAFEAIPVTENKSIIKINNEAEISKGGKVTKKISQKNLQDLKKEGGNPKKRKSKA